MGGGVGGEQELGQTGVPVPLLRDRQVEEGSTEPFTLTVASWMVRGGAGFFSAVKATKLLNQTAFKIVALVGVNVGRDTKLTKPFPDQDLKHHGGSLVTGGNGQCILAENISHDKDVLNPSMGGFQHSEVHGQDFIWLRCQQVPHEAASSWLCVYGNLAPLTELAPIRIMPPGIHQAFLPRILTLPETC